MLEEDELSQLAAVAEETGVPLYRRYTEAEAAAFLGVSLATLRRMRGGGKIAFIRVSERKVAFFGFQLLRFLLSSVEEAQCRPKTQETSNSATIGSRNALAATTGTGHGSTSRTGKRDALASARRILKKPSSD